MDNPDFATIRERLLRGGVAPRHVRRTIAELQDHHADLMSEAMSRGATPQSAAAEARRRLGEDEILVAEVLGRRELRSWSHRWPWAIYGLAPLLILVAAVGAVLAALLAAMYVQATTGGPGGPTPRWFQSLIGLVLQASTFVLPLMVAGGVCLAAGRRRSSPSWPMVGVTLVLLIGGALGLEIRWPTAPGVPGSLSVDLSLLPPFPNLGQMVLRTAVSCVLVFAPFHWLRARRSESHS